MGQLELELGKEMPRPAGCPPAFGKLEPCFVLNIESLLPGELISLSRSDRGKVTALFFFGCAGPLWQCVGSGVVVRGLRYPSACGILVSQLGIEPASPTLEGRF